MSYRRVIRERIYPDQKQQCFFEHMFGCSRFVRNRMIDVRDRAYADGELMDYDDTSYMLTLWKQCSESEFLRKADATALQQTLRDLDDEYAMYYMHIGSHPRYAEKKDDPQMYKTAGSGKKIYVRDGFLKIPKAGLVRLEKDPELGDDKICSILVEKYGNGIYQVQINIGYIPDAPSHIS